MKYGPKSPKLAPAQIPQSSRTILMAPSRRRAFIAAVKAAKVKPQTRNRKTHVLELHPTKGWRRVSRVRLESIAKT